MVIRDCALRVPAPVRIVIITDTDGTPIEEWTNRPTEVSIEYVCVLDTDSADFAGMSKIEERAL